MGGLNIQFALATLGICFTISVVHNIDYKHLMIQYFLVCGAENFCGNVTDIIGFELQDVQFHFEMCAPCKCDQMCVNRGDCCVDLFFSLPPLTCVNRTIIQPDIERNRKQQSKRLMVSTCPKTTNEQNSFFCENSELKSKLQYPPVVQTGMPIVYRNKFCAECYNISSYMEWGIDINCKKFADFNFLSSLDEVIDLAFEKDCSIQSTDENLLRPQKAQYDDYNVDICLENPIQYSRCNLTGAWDLHDDDIEYACDSTFLGKHRMFRNIFCFMCNPSPGKFKTVINTCNVTGSWKPFDEGMQIMCETLPPSPYTSPFKNVFCFLCNKDNDRNESLLEINGSIVESIVVGQIQAKYQIEYDIHVSSFNTDFFNTFVMSKVEEEPSANEIIQTKNSQGILSRNGIPVNISNLFSQYVSTFNGIGLCPSRENAVSKMFLRPCNCDPFCMFKDEFYPKHACCVDALMDYPTTCRGELDLSGDPRKYKQRDLVVNGCFQEVTRRVLFEGCINRELSDIYSILPLHRNVTWNDSITLITYDNLYCALCNLNSLPYILKVSQQYNLPLFPILPTVGDDMRMFETQESKIWSLEIVCPHILPISYVLRLGDILGIANETKCRIRYVREVNKSPRNCFDYSNHNFILSSHCDMIKDWSFPDNDIKWACLNQSSLSDHLGAKMSSPDPKTFSPNQFINYRSNTYRFYRNKFCSICKPNFSLGNLTDTISTCNETAFLSQSYLGFPITPDFVDYYYPRCMSATETYYFYPFKNIYCAYCNGMLFGKSGSVGNGDPIPGYIRVPGISWFPILRNMFSIREDMPKKELKRKITCNEDQVFDLIERRCRDITCFPGKNLINSTCVPLFTTTKMLRYNLAVGVDIKENPLSLSTNDLIHLMIHLTKTMLAKRLNLYNLITEDEYGHSNLPCSQLSPRGRNITLQIYLVIFIEKTVHREATEEALLGAASSLYSTNITAQFYTMKSAEKLPLLRHMNKYQMECFVYQNSTRENGPFRSVRVSEILLCPYVILSKNEFHFNGETMYLKRNNRVLLDGLYEIEGSTAIYVCTKELHRVGFFNDSSSFLLTDQKTLWYVSVICTVASCLCLIVSIVTYLLLPSLRTLPGKINLLTMATLLFTLLFHQMGFIFVFSDTGCAVFGVCLHYTWLCVFTTTQINTFHMNRVFASTFPAVHGYSKTILIRYVCYSFLTPFFFVSINVTYTFIITHGVSFGYGGVKCFILQTNLLIFTFIAPIALIICINIILFVWTSLTLLKAPKVLNSKGDRSDFLVILKMSSITGISWITQVIDSFFPFSELSYISTVLVCSQGIFVCLAFTTNSRVWNMYKKRFAPSKFYSESDKQPTTYEMRESQ